MTLTQRRLLYSLFFLIFFITAPIVIFWAEGYRYNFTKHKLQKAGVLFLESKPSKAEIYLNGKLQSEKTTARLKNLLPDEYQVEIKKDGYQTWQKKLNVWPGQTTFAQYVRLFKQNPEIENLFNQKILLSSQQINNKIAIIHKIIEPAVKKYTLTLFDLTNQDARELTQLNYLPDKIILSPNASFVYLKYNPEYTYQNFIFDINNQELINLQEVIQGEINHLSWAQDERNEIIYVLSTNGLEKINILSQESLVLLDKAPISFHLDGNTIFYLAQTEENILLNKSNLNNLDSFETITTLPISESYKFYNSPPAYLTLLDEKNKILYLINTQAEKDKNKIKIFSDTNYAEWTNDNKVLMFGNEFEISTYDLEAREENLVVRLSSQIKKALWYPVPTHVIYLLPDSLKIIELINHQRNLNTLISKSDIQDIFVSDKSDIIYFIDEDGINQAKIQ